MGKKKRMFRQRGQMIGLIVCLSFLLGSAGGAVAANLMGGGEQAELSAFLQQALEYGQEDMGYFPVFWKYLKYDLIIWCGGWMSLGLFFSGAAFLFRSISLGFTSAMLFMTYGGRGLWTVGTALLPQNLILIPTYSFIMAAAVYYLFSWREEGGKRALKRERRRKQTEYCILFLASALLVAAAAGIERAVLLT